MEIQVKELEYCKMNVSCIFNSEEIKAKKSEIVKIFKDAPIPGFRKGKATAQVIQHYYKNQIEESLKRALSEEAYHQSIFENQFKPIGSPQFIESFLQPASFSCQFIVHKRPDFELQDFRSWEIPEPHKDFTQDSIYQKMVEELRNINGDRVPFTEDNFVEMGDLASVSYDAYVDGVKKEEYCSNGSEVIGVGTTQLPEFDSGLLGMKSGDSREFDVTTNGVTIRFNVKMNMGIKVVPMAFDEALAKKLGKESLEELDNEVKAKSFEIFENRSKSLKNMALNNKIVASHDFAIPDWLSLAEAKFSLQGKLNWDSLTEEVKSKHIEQAAKNIKFSLVLEKIRDNEPEAQLSDVELMNFARNYLNNFSKTSVEDLIKNLNGTGQLQVLLNKIKDEHTLDFLTKTVKFIQ